ncbi:MAG: FAD/NAD(P)-binding oxidoreductase [Bacteroidetes bacterium]|nr:FAD/NAD(P)-binding oxidoreductase [Bacteroidota bacterium]MDA1120294.1 FAD/NAD(P)-binding oxidoreductase [Bacteroidota bacterium]
MKNLLILGAGTAGTMMLNKLYKKLPDDWKITIIDKDPLHYYQPGFIFIPFGIYNPESVVKPKSDFFPKGTHAIWDEVVRIDGETNLVELKKAGALKYDLLIIATGTTPRPEETPGLKGELWNKDIFDFYTFEGTSKLANRLKTWEGGELVINIAESIIKCPVAPLEFAFLADSYFKEKGIRDKVNITYTTPLAGAFTKPKATQVLSGLLEKKGIKVIPEFYLEKVDNEKKRIISYDEQEIAFDLLISIPVNMGADLVEESSMGDDDDLQFIPTDKHTLQSKEFENIFVIGDATNLPTSKAGSVAHFEAEVLTENILSYVKGEPLEGSFDGHANCFIETGNGKAALIDFNYDIEPLPGVFPIPGIGPMSLLKESRINHYGKLMFEWVYWHMLITGKKLPVSTPLSMKGKILNEV